MKSWKLLPNLFIPKKFLNDPVDYRKALMLVWSHLFMLVGVSFTYILALAVSLNLDLPIGLVTCKKIVEELNGQMWLTSTEGIGTTFHFSFPKQNEEIIAPKTEQVKLVVA